LEVGVTIDDPFTLGVGHASTDEFYIRYFEDRVEFGIRQHFDRWCNSADFLFWRIPKDLIGVKALLQAAVYCLKAGVFDQGWSKLDIYPWYRNKRKELRAEQRMIDVEEEKQRRQKSGRQSPSSDS